VTTTLSFEIAQSTRCWYGHTSNSVFL